MKAMKAMETMMRYRTKTTVKKGMKGMKTMIRPMRRPGSAQPWSISRSRKALVSTFKHKSGPKRKPLSQACGKTLQRRRKQMAAPYVIVLGGGMGRAGTKYLAEQLSNQPDFPFK
jgi:hypothetical protein